MSNELIERLEALEKRVEKAERIAANAVLQAQCWKMEARCHQSSLHRAYQAATGAKGEPGDWNGARPLLAALKGE